MTVMTGGLHMSRTLTFIAVAAVLAAGSVGGALAFQGGGGTTSDEPMITSSVFGPEPANLDAQMDSAVKDGPYSITCSPGIDAGLSCTSMPDEEVIPALKRGETVYGRTVIGFPGGAKAVEDTSEPTFEATDLVCSAGALDALECLPVTEAKPIITAGTDTFAFYRQHHVSFTADGRAIGQPTTPTISLSVAPAAG